MSTEVKSEKRWFWGLVFVYIAGVAIRFLINLFTSQNPFIMPDEALYLNIARSIANEGKITFRNQPITYTNLLYPFFISPIYAFCSAGTQFRALQLFNCFAMNLAVFPSHAIAKRFTDKKTAFIIAVISIMLPDMLLTSRAMTESIEYPLFLLTVMLMFLKLSDKNVSAACAVLTGCSAFLLSQAKSGFVVLAIVFLGILIYGLIRARRKEDIKYILVFLGTYIVLTASLSVALHLAGMDFSQKSIYGTQFQAPTLDHLKKTLPGLLLYAYFIPIAFGIFPLLLPVSNLRRYDRVQQSQLLLVFLTLVFVASGACYMFFDTETIGDYFAGRIHIRYVFMFLPVFSAFAASPRLEKAKLNGKLLSVVGFLFAMTVTVSFSALLSNRRYPVDAISLSYIIHDDAMLNWRLLSQTAMLTFTVAMLALIWKKDWGKTAKSVCAAGLISALVVANWLGYDLNNHNNYSALTEDARQAALALVEDDVLLVPDNGQYFDNTLSVLDTAMTNAPFVMLYDDLCLALGSHGTLVPTKPPEYWTEKPAYDYPAGAKVVFNTSALAKMVVAREAQIMYTPNGLFAIVSPSADGKLFHSAITGIKATGEPEQGAALYVYDEQLLATGHVRVYLQINVEAESSLTLTDSHVAHHYSVDKSSGWIYGDFSIPSDANVLKVLIQAHTGNPIIKTYQVDLKPSS